MYNENEISLIGTVGNEPEIKVIESNGKKYHNAKFSLATNKKYKNAAGAVVEKTTWHNISFYGILVEKVIEKYVHKGSYIRIKGEQDHRTYEKDGVNKYYSEVLGQSIGLLPSNKAGTNAQAAQDQQTQQHQGQSTTNQNEGNQGDEMDDLPF